jgi:hypothetical protein
MRILSLLAVCLMLAMLGYAVVAEEIPFPPENCWTDPDTGQLICLSSTAQPIFTPTSIVATPTPIPGPYTEIFLPTIYKY